VAESGICTSDAQCATSYAGKPGWGCKLNSCSVVGNRTGSTGTSTPPGTSICWGEREYERCVITCIDC
jgi:hypothetical protein